MNQSPPGCLQTKVTFYVTDEVRNIKINRTISLIRSGFFYFLFFITMLFIFLCPSWDKIIFCLGHGLLAVCFMIKYLRYNQAVQEFGTQRPIIIERSDQIRHQITLPLGGNQRE